MHDLGRPFCKHVNRPQNLSWRAILMLGSRDDAHLKPCLVEVVDVRLLDTVLRDCVPHKRKPAANNIWIFALGPLVVVFPIKTRGGLWVPFDEG